MTTLCALDPRILGSPDPGNHPCAFPVHGPMATTTASASNTSLPFISTPVTFFPSSLIPVASASTTSAPLLLAAASIAFVSSLGWTCAVVDSVPPKLALWTEQSSQEGAADGEDLLLLPSEADTMTVLIFLYQKNHFFLLVSTIALVGSPVSNVLSQLLLQPGVELETLLGQGVHRAAAPVLGQESSCKFFQTI